MVDFSQLKGYFEKFFLLLNKGTQIEVCAEICHIGINKIDLTLYLYNLRQFCKFLNKEKYVSVHNL